jgi:hypothetical protein
MGIYGFAFAAHVVGAVALLVGLVLITISLWRMPRAVTIAGFRKWAGIATKADKLLPAGAALILLSGLYMTMTVWGWSHGWANTSLAALLLMSPLTPTIIGPRLGELRKAATGVSADSVPSSLRIATYDPVLHTGVSVMMLVSLGIAAVMVTKPTTLGSIMLVAIALLVGLAAAFPAWRWRRAAG